MIEGIVQSGAWALVFGLWILYFELCSLSFDAVLEFQSLQADKTSEFKELDTKLKVQSTKSKDLRPKPIYLTISKSIH